MIKHLFKMVWNRRRTNMLLIVEIFFSFLVLFAVVAIAVFSMDNYGKPLGFSYENVWNISLDVKMATDDDWLPESSAKLQQLLNAVRDFSEVHEVAGAMNYPYSFSTMNSYWEIDGRQVGFDRNEVTDDFNRVMGLQLTRGRWFGAQDSGSNWVPMVVNERLAHEFFGEQDPIGRVVGGSSAPPNAPPSPETRVIGVVSEFRIDGEYAGLGNYAFFRADTNNPKDRPPRNILVKVRPGATADFQEKLAQRLQAVVKDWSYEIQPLAEARETMHRLRLAPIVALGLIAGFLMLMVGLGLTGVLWQNVTQRTQEIGLRRAAGAAVWMIHQQILGEILVITTMGLTAGTVLIVQLPILDVVGYLSLKVYVISLLVSLVTIFLLSLACGLYPSWMATRVHLAEALHYE